MRRVLICTVGGQPQPVVTAVRENQPLDLVVFLCSRGKAGSSSAHTIRQPTAREIRGHCPHCGAGHVETIRTRPLVELAELEERQYVIEGIEDPDDLGQVLTACGRIEAELASRWRGCGIEVIANYTGGTKTMSLGLGFYALGRARWSLQLNRVAAGGRTDLIGVRAGDQPVFQDTSKTLSETVAGWAEELALQYDYEGAAKLIGKALAFERPAAPEQAQLLSASLRLRLLAARERCEFAEALELARQDAGLEKRHGPQLKLLARIVSVLEGDGEWPDPAFSGLELVDELRETAGRAAERGRYDEAVARMYRAAGLLAQLRLRRLYGIGPRKHRHQEARIPQRLLEELRQQSPRLDLPQAYELLRELGDPLGRYFAEHGGIVATLVEQKRRSTFGEGMISIRRETWLRLAPGWRRWLDGAQEIL